VTLVTDDDSKLLDHYLERGHQRWNVSLAAAYLDYEMRRYVTERMPLRRPLRVCNVGIGVGLWDDWLGHLVGGVITSVDIDRDICELFALRQRRERHPYPARVVCGDVLAGALHGEPFDVITCIGSTLGESGAPAALRTAMVAALSPCGILIEAEVRETSGSPGVVLACTSTGPDGWPIREA
jgi:protein-L-isoaspartate O-methyltransferase